MPHAKEGLGSGLPVVGSILAARRTAQHVACLQATRATLQQQHMQFTARCLVWWVAGVLLAVLQRLLWPRLRQPRVPRPAGPDVPERPQTGQSNLILYGAVSPQQVCAAMRCAWHYHMLMGLHRHLHRPHTKVLPPPPLASSIASTQAQSPTVLKVPPSSSVLQRISCHMLPQLSRRLVWPAVPPAIFPLSRRFLPTGHPSAYPPPPITSHLPPVTTTPPHRCLPT
ncbi:hypothetical protein E2C01_093097 [Portunus trituberculatus]|uniref:Uncharacterized protein n=1 Tax=Portunus trituberculatus TaxID=210409 RepID=A0A5B7JTZ3_PORTR|nr:hypothetical protein [Portunus trituberculatus]